MGLSYEQKRKLRAIGHMGGECQKCGYNTYYGALHFHHVQPEGKLHAWRTLRKQSWSKIVEELKKCQLLCANCHVEEHSVQKDMYK